MAIAVIGFVFFLLATGRWFLGFSGLEWFWIVLMPVAVLVMYFAPMLWRNICPLATVSLWRWTFVGRRRLEQEGNRVQVLTGWRASMHEFLRKKGLMISALLFLIIVPLRIPYWNSSEEGTLFLLSIVFIAAAICGSLFPVKSGWCTSICPVAAVEKIYGLNPAVAVKNNRCHYRNKETGAVATCSGCSFNCSDVIDPEHAYWQAEKGGYFHDTTNAEARKLFIGAFPGFLAAFYGFASGMLSLPMDGFRGIIFLYLTFTVFMAISVSVYILVKRWLRDGAERCERSLDSGTVCITYAVAKRRLDMIFLTVSINTVFWFAADAITKHILVARIGLSEEAGFAAFIAFIVVFFLVSLLSLHNAWNERPTPQGYHPSWW